MGDQACYMGVCGWPLLNNSQCRSLGVCVRMPTATQILDI